jgi:penicillin-binding protein 1B
MKGKNRFPAFLDMVRRQLAGDYREEDLNGNGLKILTTLDPQVQWQVERNLDRTLHAIEQHAGRNRLEAAVVITNRESGEILALAGGREPNAAGFNRALNARRPIGSLIKPAVYLTALNQGFTLASPLQDTAVALKTEGGQTWKPQNYDRQEHGRVPLYLALANSYNLATINLGLKVGVDRVIATVKELGANGSYPPYPSFLLGTAEMTPLEVSQMYQTLASGGFFQPQRCIDSVIGADNRLLKRFGLSVEQRFAPESVFLLNTALQHAVSEGTALPLGRYVTASHKVAGKTGTTNDLRDSWFAGFTGDRLAVVWLGRDDNKPAGVTGAAGALVAWGEIIRALHPQPLALNEPPRINWTSVDKRTLAATSTFNRDSVSLPFIAGTEPAGESILPSIDIHKVEEKAKGVINSIRGLFN